MSLIFLVAVGFISRQNSNLTGKIKFGALIGRAQPTIIVKLFSLCRDIVIIKTDEKC